MSENSVPRLFEDIVSGKEEVSNLLLLLLLSLVIQVYICVCLFVFCLCVLAKRRNHLFRQSSLCKYRESRFCLYVSYIYFSIAVFSAGLCGILGKGSRSYN